MKKLIVREFIVSKEQSNRAVIHAEGEMYSYFYDPDTGKHYRPCKDFEVTGDDLSRLFVEVPPDNT